MKTALNTPPPEDVRTRLYRAAISCPHTITAGAVILYSHESDEGVALAQLADRLFAEHEAIAASLKSRADAVPMLVDALDDARGLIELYANGDTPSSTLETIDNGDGTCTATRRSAEESIRFLLEKIESAIAQVTPLLAASEKPKPLGLPSDIAENEVIRATDSQN